MLLLIFIVATPYATLRYAYAIIFMPLHIMILLFIITLLPPYCCAAAADYYYYMRLSPFHAAPLPPLLHRQAPALLLLLLPRLLTAPAAIIIIIIQRHYHVYAIITPFIDAIFILIFRQRLQCVPLPRKRRKHGERVPLLAMPARCYV